VNREVKKKKHTKTEDEEFLRTAIYNGELEISVLF
jgi:hypothetical protein